MSYLAAARRADAPYFSDRVGREVVVQHEALGLFRGQCVQPLGVSDGAESGDTENLRLAAVEQAASVRSGQEADGTGNWANLAPVASVWALAPRQHILLEGMLKLYLEGVAQMVGFVLFAKLIRDFGSQDVQLLVEVNLAGR